MEAWDPTTAWDTTVSPTDRVFTDYAPSAAPTIGQPGYNILTIANVTNCINLSILPTQCSSGAAGAIDFRPSPTFAGTEQPVVGTARSTCCATPILPISGMADGVYWVTWGTGGADPVSIFETCGGGTVTCTGTIFTASGGQKWMVVATTYNPGLVASGTALGAQMPITDHKGSKWASTPAIGAYEVGP